MTPRHWTSNSMRAAALVLASLAACTDGDGEPPVVEETQGELGQGTFRWVCVGPTDPTCGTGFFPIGVALGARFDLDFFPSGQLPGDISFYELSSVSPRRIGADLGDFVTLREGDASIIALGDGYGIDFVSLRVMQVNQLILRHPEPDDAEPEPDNCGLWGCDPQVDPNPPTTATTLYIDESTVLEALPYNNGRPLAGALAYSFDSLTPSRLRVLRDSGHAVTVEGVAEGEAELRVYAGDYSQVFVFQVEPAAAPDPTTGGETEGPGTDGSGTGGETDGSGTGGASDGSGSDGSGSDGSGTDGGSGSGGSGSGSTGGVQ